MREEFPKTVKLAAWQRCGGFCESCTAKLYVGRFEYDHANPSELGGAATLANCTVLCENCHSSKTGKHDIPTIARSNRIRNKRVGINKRKGRPMPGSRASGFKKRMDGRVERR